MENFSGLHLGRGLAIGLLPHGLVELARERRRQARTGAVSWEDARRRAGTYDDGLLNRFLVARAAGRVADGSVLRANVLALVARLVGERVVVTDFGGSTGALGADFLSAYPASTYTVVENKTLVALMPAGAVRFTSEIPAACDIFYSGGTLQYLEDPYRVLEKGMASARMAIVLRRNNFGPRETFEIQHSCLFAHGVGPVPGGFEDRPITYPRRTLVESEVVGLVEAGGFRCAAALDEVGGEGGYGRQLVFWKG